MLQQERHQQILSRLHLNGQVIVRELSQDFNVTEDCIRKDLNILEKAGKLKRIHGGAVLLRQNLHAIYVNDRKDVRHEEKKLIARHAFKLIQQGITIFLDISTVSLEIAKLIYEKNMNVIIVTNMIDIMQLFSQNSSVQLIFIGGIFNRARDGFIGSYTIEQIQQFKFDLSFIGVVGIDAYEGKVSTYDMNDGLTKKAIIQSSKKAYMVAESAKFDLDGNYIFADLSDFSGYICEKKLSLQLNKKLKRYGLDLLDEQ